MKRYIAGTNAQGQSCIESVTELDDSVGKIHIYKGDLGPLLEGIAEIEIEEANRDLQPGPHGLNWMLNRIPPDSERAKHGYAQRPMHRTRTLDLDFILDGELHCQFDLDTAVLHAGDILILRGADHLWFNPTDRVATMLNFLYEPR